MNDTQKFDEIEELKTLVVSLADANNQAHMQYIASQHVIMSMLQVAHNKEEIKYYIDKCASAYLAYANDIGQEENLIAHYQDAIQEYTDLLEDEES